MSWGWKQNGSADGRLAASQAMRQIATATRSGAPVSADRVVELLRTAVDNTPAGDRDRPRYLCNLGSALLREFEQTGRPELLDEAIGAHQAAVDGLPEGHRNRPMYLVNLAQDLIARFALTDSQANLDTAVDLATEAERTLPPRHPFRARALSALAVALRRRGEARQDLADLNHAIDAAQGALRAARPRDPHRGEYGNALALALMARHEQVGDATDLAEAIEAARDAAAADVASPVDRAMFLCNLCAALSLRFAQHRDLADVAEAIDAGRAAVALVPPGHPERVKCLANLGGPLRARYEQVGERTDLDEAIATVRAAVAEARVQNQRGILSANLASLLYDRFRQAGELTDLDESVEASRMSVSLIPSGQPSHAASLTTLCVTLTARFERTRQVPDLNEAIDSGRAALRVMPSGHRDRALTLNALGLALAARYWQTRDPADLEQAILTARAAVHAAPAGHPDHVGYLSNLAWCVLARSDATGDARIRAEAFALWRQAAEVQSGPAGQRLAVALWWGEIAAQYGETAEAEAGYTAAVELLPLAAWAGLSRPARQQHLAERIGLASDAAAWAISAGHPERAVQLLEHGRSVLWSHALQLRGDFDDLRAKHHGLARRLDAARAVLDAAAPGAPDAGSGMADPARGGGRDEDRMRAADEWDHALATTRSLPSFAGFLQPSPFAELASSAGPGPVVIVNVSRYRCDALVVTPDGVRVVPLPGLTLNAVTEHVGRFRQALAERPADQPAGVRYGIKEVLAWLWDTVAGPVLEDLGHKAAAAGDSWPRVWWCPTGPLTALPLHAAGRPPHSAVLDRVVSSYTPTLLALARAQPAAGQYTPRILLVAMPTTPGLRDGAPLAEAKLEADTVAEVFPDAHTLRVGEQATRHEVLADLGTHAYAHFACHGGIDQDQPQQSGLLLADGRLTIDELSRQELPPGSARLAFLSACDTGSPSAALPDEAITMAAALQIAGFHHVIATLWPIRDAIAAETARNFYQALIASRGDQPAGAPAAADALHAAVRHLRSDHADPADWAAYIHCGR
jgi:tetratricopeptide (TPR) repeat protein